MAVLKEYTAQSWVKIRQTNKMRLNGALAGASPAKRLVQLNQFNPAGEKV